jgi:hypothetical protein
VRRETFYAASQKNDGSACKEQRKYKRKIAPNAEPIANKSLCCRDKPQYVHRTKEQARSAK